MTPVHVAYRAGARDFATTFSPHALVRTAHRLHFGGYLLFQDDVGRGHYWNMVASRGKASSRARVRLECAAPEPALFWLGISYISGTSQTQFRASLCVNTPPSVEAMQTKPAMDRVKRPDAGMSQAISASDFGCHASIADRAIVGATRERRAVHLIRAGRPHGEDCKCNRNAVTTDYRRRS